jgi:23S rRNA (pseudouridine1915-N3)-methyltransferase
VKPALLAQPRNSGPYLERDGDFVKIKVVWIGKTKEPAVHALTNEYLTRISHYATVEAVALADEAALLRYCQRTKTRSPHTLVLLDSRGKQLSSEEFAKFLQDQEARHPAPLLLAVGPADGFKDETREAAAFLLSLGKMTLPHELARIILLEQLYRAFTILKRHPYHRGH